MKTLSVAIALIFVAATVQAGPWNVSDLHTGSKLKLYDSFGQGTTNGGVFIVKRTDGSEWFRTFCVETGEFINYGTTYEVVINTKAIKGGTTSSPYEDTISKGTAALFLQFWNTPDHLIDDTVGDRYQRAIWYLEGESGGSLDDTAKGWLTNLLGTSDESDWKSNYDPTTSPVRVLNLWEPGKVGDLTKLHQDQLVVIPEPATLALLGLSLLGLGASARIRRRTHSA